MMMMLALRRRNQAVILCREVHYLNVGIRLDKNIVLCQLFTPASEMKRDKDFVEHRNKEQIRSRTYVPN